MQLYNDNMLNKLVMDSSNILKHQQMLFSAYINLMFINEFYCVCYVILSFNDKL